MPHVLIRHKVEDYTKWKAVFDAHKAMRKAGGEKTYHIFHAASDPNNLVLLFEWNSLDNARRFLESQELRQAMRSEERRVGKECTSWCRSRWWPYH